MTTYHGNVSVFLQQFCNLRQLVLKVVDPDVADVGALGGVAV